MFRKTYWKYTCVRALSTKTRHSGYKIAHNYEWSDQKNDETCVVINKEPWPCPLPTAVSHQQHKVPDLPKST